MYYSNRIDFDQMVGKTFRRVYKQDEGIGDSDALVFEVSDTESYAQLYERDCCASCSIEDICGDLHDLENSLIVRAEENGNEEPTNLPSIEESPDSFTWTFYRIGTTKGTVVIRWYGSSNGYYSETPYFCRIV